MNVQFPKLKKKRALHFFTLNKKTDEEIAVFDIVPKRKKITIDLPEKLCYEIKEYKISKYDIICSINWMMWL